MNDTLACFLEGTLCRRSPISRLRGQTDILRMIWTLACEEWWDLHIQRFKEEIPILLKWDRDAEYPKSRQECGGCPIAVLKRDVQFPEPAVLPENSYENQESEHLYINMMPIDLKNLVETLPTFCTGYLKFIKYCRRRMKGYGTTEPSELIGFLTIDERPCNPSDSQRRGGLHVESPGVMPVITSVEQYVLSGNYVPGAEHHWGNGMMMRHESIQGGIFMASNIANTCAVWNSRVIDHQGDIVGWHGDIERLRPLLGPPSRTLEAGELVWMTDKTPHESLPIPPGNEGTRRQFFRLVVGEVTAWFADHCTPNPLGVQLPPEVRVVTGNKFQLCPHNPKWVCGTREEICIAEAEKNLRSVLHTFGLGHTIETLLEQGIRTTRDLLLMDIHNIFPDYGARYYDIPRLEELKSFIQESLNSARELKFNGRQL